MDRFSDLAGKVVRGNKRATMTLVLAALAIFTWFVLTLLLMKLVADAQTGQLLAFFVLIGQQETGGLISRSLLPAAKLAGLFWAVLTLWIIPAIVAAYRWSWWPFDK